MLSLLTFLHDEIGKQSSEFEQVMTRGRYVAGDNIAKAQGKKISG